MVLIGSCSEVFELREQITFFFRQQNFGILAEKFSQEEFIAKIAYLAVIFDSLNSLNLSMQGAGFTVIEEAAKVAAYHKKLALWKSSATRDEYDMFPKLKHYLCDKEVNINQTVIGHLEMLAQKFEDYYGEALTPSDENNWILGSFAGTDLPHLPLHVTKKFMNRSNKSYFFCDFKRTIAKRICKYPLLGFHESSVSNSFEICDKKIDSVCDNLALRNCILRTVCIANKTSKSVGCYFGC